jgi:hypothetical protein
MAATLFSFFKDKYSGADRKNNVLWTLEKA